MHKLSHILRLGLKELTSLRHDSVLLLFLFYAFTVAIYMPAAGSIIGVHNASVAIVDEDHSALSRKLAQSLLPPEFQAPQALPYDQLDQSMDSGKYTFVINVPVNFQADLLAGREPSVQVNVDATAMSQAFMGAGYIGRIFQRELLNYTGQADAAAKTPVLISNRALFNPNLEGGWFLAVIQIVNNITILAIVLTGTALLREREHGTLDHLLVLPLTAQGYSHAAIGAFGLVGVIGALGAARAGALADKGRAQWTTGAALLLLLAAWLPLGFAGTALWPLIVGIIALDLAGQAIHVTNQSLIFKQDSDAHSRLVACYMLFYAVGSGLGAIAATSAYALAGWHAVCALGAAVSLLALLFWRLTLPAEKA